MLHYRPRGGTVLLCGGKLILQVRWETAILIPPYITSPPDKVHRVLQGHTNSPDVY